MTELLKSKYNLAIKLAKEAGALIKKMRTESSFELSFKGSELNLLTTADLASDKLIRSAIKEHFPDDHILSEELQTRPSNSEMFQNVWIIDPIDGTTNYAQGHVHTAVSIAYAESGKIKAGVVHAPFLGETYHAIKNSGAFCNEQRLTVSKTTQLKSALIATGFPYQRDHIPLLAARLSKILENCRDIRRFGACSLDVCLIAAGKLDGYYESVETWDIAAARLILEEAGGGIAHIGGIPDESKKLAEFFPSNVVAANLVLLPQLVKILEEVG